MTKFFSCLFTVLFFWQASFAQDSVRSPGDSPLIQKTPIRKPDTSFHKKAAHTQLVPTIGDSPHIPSPDTLHALAPAPPAAPLQPAGAIKTLALFRKVLKMNTWFNFSGKPLVFPLTEHNADSKEGLFYLLVGLVLYFALIRIFFSKYLNYLISLFLRASLRQQQIREQLLQTPLPSLLLNILFVLSSGLYVDFLAGHFGLARGISFWLLLLDCCFLVGMLYLLKFIILKMAGWIFSIPKVTDTYIFIVFMVNKVLGILLLPFVIVLSFAEPGLREIAFTVSMIAQVLLFVYRFIASYPAIRSEIKVSVLYFFLYLCAFEIAPLLLIYKVLLTYLEKAF